MPGATPPRLLRGLRLVVWGALAVAALGACGEKKKERIDPQVAARVNDRELTVQQINLVLQQQRNLRPDQADMASRQVLERLIDQSLAVQKAESLKLDDDPRVQQQIEAARREVLARAYADRVGEAAPKASPEDIAAYYRGKPALFAERRIYNIQELAVEARPDQVPLLREQLAQAGSITDFIDFLRANDYRFAANQAVRAAEQLPMNVLDALARMSDGQATLTQGSNGVLVVVLAGSRSQPVSEDLARPVIEQYLLNERRRQRVEAEMKALRGSARIEYLGRFADGPRPGASAPEPAAAAGSSPLGLN